MSDTLKTLKEKAEKVKEYLSVLEVPESIDVKLIGDLEFKKDKRGNEACFITLETRDAKIIVQKYTSTNYAYLYDAISKLGDIEFLKKDFITWKKAKVGRSINERLFPMPKIKKEKV
jgi:predicted nucleotide-binding protein (sugar kinase/HSP70/actin superfamily)